MGIKFSNNASANIVQALTSTATSVSITPGKGDLFPSITEGDYFYATLAGNKGLEIVKVTNRVNDTMTIVRAQDNTPALSFDTGDLFELRIVAADFNDTFSEVNDKLENSIEEITSKVNSALDSKAPILHSSSSTEYGSGSSEQYGHLKSHDEPDSTFTSAGGHAFSPAGAASLKTELEEQIEEVETEASAQLSSLDTSLRTLIAEEVEKCLKANGDTMTVPLTFDNTGRITWNDSENLLLLQAFHDGAMGAQCGLRSKDAPSLPGTIVLQPRKSDGSDGESLIVYPDGKVTIGTGHLEPTNQIATGVVRHCCDDGVLSIFGATEEVNGAMLDLNGSERDHAAAGGFVLGCRKDGAYRPLRGFPDGRLLWDGNRIPTIVASGGSNANWYRKWSDGLIEQCGYVTAVTSGDAITSVTFATPFAKTYPTIIVTPNGGGTRTFTLTQATSTGFKAQGWNRTSSAAGPPYMFYYASGY